MNYLGIYHSNSPKSTIGVCDAPCVAKGRMLLCAPGVASEGQQLAMVFGQIRNRERLLRTLDAKPSTSDAQLALKAYLRWGNGYPAKIEGAATTCIMDVAEDRMILTRDRMGETPVFYTLCSPDGVVFSDHPDSLLKTASALPVMDRDGLCELFALGPARTPGRTPLRDVLMLEEGCALIAEHGCVRMQRYFSIRERAHQEDEAETILHTRRLLEQAVESAIEQRPGSMLSGGLDSTALTALLCQKMGRIQTFSVDYQDDEKDFRPSAFRPSMDAPYIEMAVRAFRTDHHRFVLEQAALAEALEQAVSARGFPGMADIDSSLLLFARKIKPYVSTVVSGECGDEVFGGYPWFRGDAPFSADAFPWSGSVALRERILRPEIREKLGLQEYIRNAVADAIAWTGIKGDEDDRETRLKRMQLICFRFFMANLQERALRMCGHCGLKVLTPLCDDRLVEYVFNVPWNTKFMNGMEKGLFRAAVQDLMPAELNQRKKSPYPKTSSPIYTEIIRSMTMAMLADGRAPIWEWVDPQRVRFIAESPMDPTQTPWFGQLMAGPQMLAYLWQVNTWLRERNITASL